MPQAAQTTVLEPRDVVPTVLVAGEPGTSWDFLITGLQREGYLVLVARGASEALVIAKTHSRPIHLLLTDQTLGSSSLLTDLACYHPGIHFLIAAAAPAVTLEQARKLLKRLGRR